MCSLSFYQDVVTFPETIKFLDRPECPRHFITSLSEMYAQSAGCVNLFASSITHYESQQGIIELPTLIDDDTRRRCIFVTNCDKYERFPHVSLYPEMDYWFISLIFDTFPFHTVDIQEGSVIVVPSCIKCKIVGDRIRVSVVELSSKT